MAKKKNSKDDITVDFYNGNKITRPDPRSTLRYDFDLRLKGEKIWKYLNSSDDLSAFDEQVKVATESGDKGEYRILISETQEVIRTNVR
jgi:hypothetical protein